MHYINWVRRYTYRIPDMQRVSGPLEYAMLSMVAVQVIVPASLAVRSQPVIVCDVWPWAKHLRVPL